MANLCQSHPSARSRVESRFPVSGCSRRGIFVTQIRQNSRPWVSNGCQTGRSHVLRDLLGSARRRQILGNVQADVHRVVQKPEDVDRALARRAIEDEMSPSSALPCNMERVQAGLDVIPRAAIGRKRIIGQCNERADERLAIDGCLSSPE